MAITDLIHTSLLISGGALIVSIAAMIYSVRKSKQALYIHEELAEQRQIGTDAWVAKHIQRWRDGNLRSRIEKGVGVSGTDVEIIEPLPGWKIVVATIENGKRIPIIHPIH